MSKEIETVLNRLGLKPDASIVEVDKIQVWMVSEIVTEVVSLKARANGNGMADNQRKIWSYLLQTLNSCLANVTRRQALHALETNPHVSVETRSYVQAILEGSK